MSRNFQWLLACLEQHDAHLSDLPCRVQVVQPSDLVNAILQTATDATLISRSSTRLRVPRYAIMHTDVTLTYDSNVTYPTSGVATNATAFANINDSILYGGSSPLAWPSGGVSLYNDFFLSAPPTLVRAYAACPYAELCACQTC
jgi:hypothetical protein